MGLRKLNLVATDLIGRRRCTADVQDDLLYLNGGCSRRCGGICFSFSVTNALAVIIYVNQVARVEEIILPRGGCRFFIFQIAAEETEPQLARRTSNSPGCPCAASLLVIDQS